MKMVTTAECKFISLNVKVLLLMAILFCLPFNVCLLLLLLSIVDMIYYTFPQLPL